MKPLLTSSEAEQVQYLLCAQIQMSRFPAKFLFKEIFLPKSLSSFTQPCDIVSSVENRKRRSFQIIFWFIFSMQLQWLKAFWITDQSSSDKIKKSTIWNLFIYTYNYYYYFMLTGMARKEDQLNQGQKLLAIRYVDLKRSFKLNYFYYTKTKLNWMCMVVV